MRKGKLTENEIRVALNGITAENVEVLFGVAVGEDCAVLLPKGKILLTTDPITGECNNIEELAININANDIYASGGDPFAALMTVIAPPTESVDRVVEIIKKTNALAKQKGIDIIGGHTEFSDAVNRTIVSLTMVGRVDKPIINAPKIGDKLIVTKYLGIEATKILLGLERDSFALSQQEIADAESLDLSVELESKAVRGLSGVTAMHDITEGGLYGASCEIVKVRGLGVTLCKDSFPILAATAKICRHKNFDIGYTISSGAMLIATDTPTEVLNALRIAGVKATVVGEVTSGECVVVSGGESVVIQPQCDELFK